MIHIEFPECRLNISPCLIPFIIEWWRDGKYRFPGLFLCNSFLFFRQMLKALPIACRVPSDFAPMAYMNHLVRNANLSHRSTKPCLLKSRFLCKRAFPCNCETPFFEDLVFCAATLGCAMPKWDKSHQPEVHRSAVTSALSSIGKRTQIHTPAYTLQGGYHTEKIYLFAVVPILPMAELSKVLFPHIPFSFLKTHISPNSNMLSAALAQPKDINPHRHIRLNSNRSTYSSQLFFIVTVVKYLSMFWTQINDPYHFPS